MRTALLVAASLALLVGCGSQPSAPESPTSSTEHGSLAHCLAEHGVTETAVSPAGPPPGVDEKTWTEAMQACNKLGPGPG